MHSDNLIPEQQKGAEKNIFHSVDCDTQEKAILLFDEASTRLLDVNHWEDLCGFMSATFCLMDSEGKHLQGLARKDDYIRIDIPGPGANAGNGYDWVIIESIAFPNDTPDHQSVAMKVRPTAHPVKAPTDEVAHFLDEAATSTFEVERNGKEVKAAIYGRNEMPNTKTTNIMDKARNALIGVTAIFGVADMQWEKLVKALLEE